jgi:quinol monooxygenase YgiN
MVNVLVRHKIADYQKWRVTFDASIAFRQQGGEESCRIFQNSEDPNKLILLFEWESAEKARHFMSSPELQARMQQAGVVSPPEIEFLNELHTLRKSAAD